MRRYMMDRDVDREQRRIVKAGGRSGDVWEDGGWQFEYQMLEEDETRHHTRQLLARARSLRLPVPPLMNGKAVSNDYQQSGVNGHVYYLSLLGEQKLRAAIRDEEKHRAESRARLLPYLTALSGLIGTITGLVAVLMK